MAILSFRKLIASIFIFLSVAGLLFTIFELLTGKQDSSFLSIAVVFGVILGVAYYLGYIFKPENSLVINQATCNALSSGSSGSSGSASGSASGSSSGSPYAASTPSSSSSTPGPNDDQVFNVSQNVFRYDQAEATCSKFNSKLATVEQLKGAYKKGANWCNYGWTQGGFALYPIQPGYFNSIQSNKDCKWKCGSKPGLVGGRMDSNYTLGVNCYGKPPKGEKNKTLLKCQQKSLEADNLINNLTVKDLMVNSFN